MQKVNDLQKIYQNPQPRVSCSFIWLYKYYGYFDEFIADGRTYCNLKLFDIFCKHYLHLQDRDAEDTDCELVVIKHFIIKHQLNICLKYLSITSIISQSPEPGQEIFPKMYVLQVNTCVLRQLKVSKCLFKMRDWLKILLAVGGGAAVALVIALPIVLTGEDAPSVPEDPGQNRNAKNV